MGATSTDQGRQVSRRAAGQVRAEGRCACAFPAQCDSQGAAIPAAHSVGRAAARGARGDGAGGAGGMPALLSAVGGSAEALEARHVHAVYDAIAPAFDKTRSVRPARATPPPPGGWGGGGVERRSLSAGPAQVQALAAGGRLPPSAPPRLGRGGRRLRSARRAQRPAAPKDLRPKTPPREKVTRGRPQATGATSGAPPPSSYCSPYRVSYGSLNPPPSAGARRM